eukprot:6776402-Ditylum_brightwellii.AAC.1
MQINNEPTVDRSQLGSLIKKQNLQETANLNKKVCKLQEQLKQIKISNPSTSTTSKKVSMRGTANNNNSNHASGKNKSGKNTTPTKRRSHSKSPSPHQNKKHNKHKRQALIKNRQERQQFLN